MIESIEMAELHCTKEMYEAAYDVLKSGRYIKGGQLAAFETEFASFCDTAYATMTNSGTSALMLALETLNLNPGDEVLVPSHTFIATVNTILFTGATPVFVDIDPATYLMDPSDLRGKITDRSRAILPVHLYGQMCDMNTIMEIASEHGPLFVIEDACQAHGAMRNGQKAGSIGDLAVFSFFPSKNMTVCGDGGAVVTGNKELAEKVHALCDQGRLPGDKYLHTFKGYNFRMSEIHAAIGRVQLRELPEWNEKRRLNAADYNNVLKDFSELTLPVEQPDSFHVYHQYVIRTKNRDALQTFLKTQGVSTGIHYPIPCHKQPFIAENISLPQTEMIVDQILSLPVHPFLKEEDITYIAEVLGEFKW